MVEIGARIENVPKESPVNIKEDPIANTDAKNGLIIAYIMRFNKDGFSDFNSYTKNSRIPKVAKADNHNERSKTE